MEAAREQREREAVLESALQLDVRRRGEEPEARRGAERARAHPGGGRRAGHPRQLPQDPGARRASASTRSRTAPRRSRCCARATTTSCSPTSRCPGWTASRWSRRPSTCGPTWTWSVITGYGTIETAVETMQFGAVDYVQKPFTEEELVAFANRLLIKREARLEAQRRPTVRVVAPGGRRDRGRAASTACRAARSSPRATPGRGSTRPARCGPGSTTSRARRSRRSSASSCRRSARRVAARRAAVHRAPRRRSRSRFLAPVSGEVTQVNDGAAGASRELVVAEPLRPRLGLPGAAQQTWRPSSTGCASASRSSRGTRTRSRACARSWQASGAGRAGSGRTSSARFFGPGDRGERAGDRDGRGGLAVVSRSRATSPGVTPRPAPKGWPRHVGRERCAR